ncbi:MAG TPA: hypothetical protein VK000_03055, partial [Luteimonas sp.]|nr:hypothetical protein [Luteimonas sp.]
VQCLRPDDGEALHFVAPGVLDTGADRIEVARAVEPDAFDEVQVPLQQCSDMMVLESAGDYLLLAAHPSGHA